MIKKSNIFSNISLDRLASIKQRGWILNAFLAILTTLSMAINHLGSRFIYASLLVMLLVSVFVTLFYRREPRSLNRLLFMSNVILFSLICILNIALLYWTFADNANRALVMRVGFIFLIPFPLLVGLIFGFLFGQKRWSRIRDATFSDRISERETYDLFFMPSVSSKSGEYVSGIMWLFVLLLVALKPLVNDGGILLIGLALSVFSMGMVVASISIRHYYFLKKSRCYPVFIVND